MSKSKLFQLGFAALAIVVFGLVACGGGGGGSSTTVSPPILHNPTSGTFAGNFTGTIISSGGSIIFTGDEKGSFTASLGSAFKCSNESDVDGDTPASASGFITVNGDKTGYDISMIFTQQKSDHSECPSLPSTFFGSTPLVFTGKAYYDNGIGNTLTFTASNGIILVVAFGQ